MHSLTPYSKLIQDFTPAHLKEFERATYFVLESYTDSGDHIMLASIEDAEDAGGYGIHFGLPDRPDMRTMLFFEDLAGAVDALAIIKSGRPDAGLWLSTMQVLAEIEGRDVWLGVLNARASADPSDLDCPWVQLAGDYAAGRVTHQTYGGGDWHDEHWLYATIAGRI